MIRKLTAFVFVRDLSPRLFVAERLENAMDYAELNSDKNAFVHNG